MENTHIAPKRPCILTEEIVAVILYLIGLSSRNPLLSGSQMKIVCFSAKNYEIELFEQLNEDAHIFHFVNEPLTMASVSAAKETDVVCCFVTDDLSEPILIELKKFGVQLIALRSAGYDHVDLTAAKQLGLPIVRVPQYSPEAIAEFTIGMILALSRKLLRANDRVRQHQFSLEGQLGFNLNKRTVGVIGTGHIGSLVAKLLLAFGCNVLAHDLLVNQECSELGVKYVSNETLFSESDIISLHCPLNASTHYIINDDSIEQMKQGVMIINTGRGGLLDTSATIRGLESKKISALGIDVYEHENGLFFEDHPASSVKDELFLRLQQFPNVFITGHQAYFSEEALTNIIKSTLENVSSFQKGVLQNAL